MKKHRKKILLLSANPRGTAALQYLGQEYRDIQSAIERSPFRESFIIDKLEAVRVKDLTRVFSSSEPQVVHFSGHGSGESGLALEDDNGNIQLASTEALAELFSLHKKTIKCVFLNACYSTAQAEAISQHIGCVVGMSQRIDDKLATQFSEAFYQALSNGRRFSYCYDLAKTTINLSGVKDFSTARLLIPKDKDIENPLGLKIDEAAAPQPIYNQNISGVAASGDSTVNVIQGNGSDITINQNKITQISVDEVKTRSLNIDSPYKGLKQFEPKDKERFFGREQFLKTPLLESLQKMPLMMLLGASGSGKSSVIRAGLIPALENKSINDFLHLTFTPDYDPFESLYGALMQSGFKQAQAKLVRDKRPGALYQLVHQLKAANSYWLIVVDQFEELFTVTEPRQRDRFIKEIVKLSQAYAYDPSLKIVLTMRSDFLSRLDASPANLLAKATEGSRPIITQMHADELRLAIEQPAAQHGVVFEKGLVEEITKAVLGQAGALPLLQYTLDLLWNRERKIGGLQDRTLHTKTYREIGGVRGALQQRMDELYVTLSESEQISVQRVFLRLVDIENNADPSKKGKALESAWTPVRRRARKSEFVSEAENQIVKQLIDANLLVSDDPSSNNKRYQSTSYTSTIEIAHEILLTCWIPLKTWIQENQQAIVLRNRLNDDLVQWKNGNRSENELWSGSKLEKALELRQDSAFNQIFKGFTPEESGFIENSLNFRESQRRRTIVGLIGFSAFALLLAGLAGVQWRRAELAKIQEEIQTSQAEFSASKVSLEPLISSLIAANSLKELPLSNSNADLRASVTQSLSQAILSVREKNRLLGHTGAINGVSFSPDGKTLATASLEGTAKIWNLRGEELNTLTSHENGVTSVAFSPDGSLLATASQDRTAKLWTLGGEELHTLEGHNGEIWSVSFSPNSQKIATASDDGTVRFWNRKGQALPLMLKGNGGEILNISFSPDGKIIATANKNGSIELWDQQGKLKRRLSQHKERAVHLSFSPDGKDLVSSSDDKTAAIWNLGEPDTSPLTLNHTRAVNSAFFSPDSKYVFTAGNDGNITVWDRQGKFIERLEGHTDRVNGLGLQTKSSREGELLFASVSDDKTIRIWDLNSDREQILSSHNKPVFAASFLSNSASLVTAGNGGEILVWDKNGNVTRKIDAHTKAVYGLSVSLNGEYIASASGDGTAKIWRTNGQLVSEISKKSGYFSGISFSPTEQKVATASEDGKIEIWDYDGNLLITFNGHEGKTYAVSFSADGNKLLTAGVDGTVKLWSQDGSLIQVLGENLGEVYRAAFDSSNLFFATGGEDTLVRVWTINGDLIATLRGHDSDVWGVAFSPNGNMIATGSDDKTVRLWEKDGNLIAVLPSGEYGDVNVVNFSADGRYLVSGHASGTVLKRNIGDLSIDALLERGCAWIEDYKQNSLIGIKKLAELNICGS